jgi:hypothetical protein
LRVHFHSGLENSEWRIPVHSGYSSHFNAPLLQARKALCTQENSLPLGRALDADMGAQAAFLHALPILHI